ncbi:MAG: protoheme IX farnesyltransferase, partial [Acidobacteria bacterium]
AVGFVMASPGMVSWALLVHTVIGTALVASGASALNQVIERASDARMRRTARRPLPAGRLGREQALVFGAAVALAGMLYLALLVNLLTAALGALTLSLYVFVYTPLKRHSPLATLVGAVPGAVPPVMGCAAASDALGPLAWSLFGILFLWQMPHFLAIAWLYRSDYARGGFPMLSVLDENGQRTARQAVLYGAALIPVSLLPAVVGASGLAYLVGASVLGVVFLGYGVAFARAIGLPAARRLVLASVLYLPLLLGLLLVDRALPGA